MKRTDLVLLGGGHAQVAVLKSFGLAPMQNVRITLISRDRHTPYSGMLPGYIEGRYDARESSIDLVRLAEFARARFIHDAVAGLDAERQILTLEQHPPLNFDILSVNTGATPMMDAVKGAADYAIPIKPVPALMARLDAVMRGDAPCRQIGIIGGGIAGVEVALALDYRLNRIGGGGIKIHLIDGGMRVAPALAPVASRWLMAEMLRRDIDVHLGRAAVAVASEKITLADGTEIGADLTLMTTGAAPPLWLKESGLALDAQGFMAVDSHLQSLSHPSIFGAGDVATLTENQRPKSGVYAVRAGPILRDNLRAVLAQKPLRKWTPQQRHLALIGLGGGRALAAWIGSGGGIALPPARYLWRVKEWIDRRFIRRYAL